MKNLLLAVLCLLCVTVYGQETSTQFDGHKWEAPYLLPVPKDWTLERFLLPPFFAPQISYKGVEDIRFTPGWGNSKSEEYWTYAFLWYLDDKPLLNKTSIESDLKAYYTGLIKVNTDSSKHSAESPIPVITEFELAESSLGESYKGTIQMLDFMTRKPITLNCIMRSKSCIETGKTILFFELSPQPFTHGVWKSLDRLWQDFKCKKS